MNQIGEFIAAEMKKRDMSARQFSELVGVNHKTINKFLSPDEQHTTPSVEFLLKLANATGTNVMTLVGIAYPGVAEQMTYEPTSELLAHRFSQLGSEEQRVVLALVNQLLSEHSATR